MNRDSNSQRQAREFFEASYQHLRPHRSMRWMARMFDEVITGRYPRLVDLRTGAGKTELIVVWLLALAWYGVNHNNSHPVPRRLIWVVNRRVLVQQVFTVARELLEELTTEESPELNVVRDGLRALSGNASVFFDVVQLRGQIVANRDWAIQPTVPQLIIGTVDQIGSRLLFQGYGLGKWGRPQQAGLLGVDSWIAIDESHLVPAFVLTLRQVHPRCAAATDKIPQPLDQFFRWLPFWLTELSATPGLPPPSSDKPFQLTDEEQQDPAIADRILAANTRRVEVVWLTVANGKKPKDVLVEELAKAAFDSKEKFVRVAAFTRDVKTANEIEKHLKKKGVSQTNICKITGRVRGYERDRVIQNDAFRRFLPQGEDGSANPVGGTVFLIGTAAAEVGLDADADIILCDFAPLPTLLQRLGRLDRRGEKSKKSCEGGEPPIMRIFVPVQEKSPEQQQTEAKERTKKEAFVTAVANALSQDTSQCSAQLLAGANWLLAAQENPTAKNGSPEEAENAARNSSDAEIPEDETSDKKSAKTNTDELVETATWKVLNVQPNGTCAQPANWLSQQEAPVAAGPVVVPPLTDAILDHWCATTEYPSRYLTPHPFLYGLLTEDEGTPLIGVAFRLEVDVLRQVSMDSDDDDTEEPTVNTEVIEIFAEFPPQRAELHQIPLHVVREWLASPGAIKHPILYRTGERWCLKPLGEASSTVVDSLTPGMTLVLPASANMETSCKKLLEDCQAGETALCDVLDGVSKDARYRREVKEKQRGKMELHSCKDGAWLWDESAKKQGQHMAHIPLNVESGEKNNWKLCLLKKLRIHGGIYLFRYFKQRREQGELQYLDDVDGRSGHISRARNDAARLSAAVAPGDEFLKNLLCAAALHHDEGKRHKKWQRAFGREEEQPELAKLHPELERNAPLHGFRHEWESLCRLKKANVQPPQTIPSKYRTLWCDLLFYLVGIHHGYLRPSLENSGLSPDIAEGRQNPQRLEAAKRFASLQKQIGPWRLAYLEVLLKTADALASQEEEHDED